MQTASSKPITPQNPAETEAWLSALTAGRDEKGVEIIRRAAGRASDAHAGQSRASGDPYINHALSVADILCELGLDHESIAAAILHDVVEDTDITIEEIASEFGPVISKLVDGVTKMDVIHAFSESSDADQARERAKAESLRKMLIAMVEDVRVVLIKLADRLHNMRTLKPLRPEKQQRIAKETLDIFAPLANRLGVWQLKWELEDLSLRYLQPRVYHDIARKLAERRIDRERYIKEFIAKVVNELRSSGVDAEVYGRPKHIYSIWNKMQRKDVDFEHVFDVRAIRILTESVRDCYAALGVVHTLWPHISGEFDDYIATPKENNYQSIHTAVVGPKGRIVEVQIRTREMHEHNELGVASHWRYKEGGKQDQNLDRKIIWLRQLLEWKDEMTDAAEFVESVKSDAFGDQIYLFTPQGRVVDLPQGATPVDFAYSIHTEVGHRCRGAKVNGRIVPLTYRLKTGEQVEILTVKSGGPSRDWLSPHAGYVQTSRARSRIQRWFKQENVEENIAHGKRILTKELHRLGLNELSLDKLAKRLNFDKVDDMFRMLAEGELKPMRVVNAAQEITRPAEPEQEPIVPARQIERSRTKGKFKIHGVGNLMTNIAACCRPVPGEAIVGYITQGKGVSIHRRDCGNILKQQTLAPERLVEVEWGGDFDDAYPVDISVLAYDRAGLLRDVTSVLGDEKINVLAMSTQVDKKEHMARIQLTVEVSDLIKISQVLSRIQQIPNVTEARRRFH